MKLGIIANMCRRSPTECPFAPTEKNIIPAIIAGAAALGGAVINGISGKNAQDSANEANAQMNRENIQMQRETNNMNRELHYLDVNTNKQMMREQNQFNLDMWNKQNVYNDPSNAAKRLIAAGINPAFGMGNAGNATSTVSSAGFNGASGGNNMQSPSNSMSMQAAPFQMDVGQAVNAFNASMLANSQKSNIEANTHGTVLDNEFKMKGLDERLKFLQNQAKREGIAGDIAKQQLAFINATQDWEIQMKYGDMHMQSLAQKEMNEKISNIKLQNDLLNIQNAYAGQLSKAQLASIWTNVQQAHAQIGLINANRMLTDTQREHEIERVIGTKIDNGLKGIDFHIKNSIKGCLIKDQSNRTEMLDFSRRNQKTLTRVDMLSSVVPFAGGLGHKIGF